VSTVKTALTEFYYSNDPKTMMCSKCHPCKLGIYDAVQILELIQTGKGDPRHGGLLKRIAEDVKDGGMCKKGKDQADVLAAMLRDHAEDLNRHVEGVCIHGECARLVRYEINPDRCTNCDKCREVCAPFAIEGEKRKPFVSGYLPYRIRQKRCTHCGECIKVCPEGAIYVVAEVAEAVGAGK